MIADTQKTKSVRLDFLDGIRGLSALYVVLYHTIPSQAVEGASAQHALVRKLTFPIHQGHLAVAIFIVLSGYCLMLPVAKSTDGQLRDGALNYIKRRARRILPTYYAALLLSFAISTFWVRQGWVMNPLDTDKLNLLAHVGLVHNLIWDYAISMNAPLWSVAMEWQIYFLLPLLLLPLWRKLNSVVPIVVGLLLGLAPLALYYAKILKLGHTLWWTFPWYIGLFAMGMAAASIGFSERDNEPRWRDNLNWPLLSLLSLVLCGVVRLKIGAKLIPEIWMCDILMGLAAACFILACANKVMQKPHGISDIVVQALSAKPLQKLGSFSYSLYLIHVPVLTILVLVDRAMQLDPVNRPLITTLTHLIIGPAIALPAAYGFHLLFEKPFQRKSI